MVEFFLDGKARSVEEGSTVMEAAAAAGVQIPHFCWHRGLSVAGVCRFCLVEVEGRPKLEIACNLPVAHGMKVRTDSERVLSARKWALEFHLVNHPLDCPVCDQAGECGLQDYYMSAGRYSSQVTTSKVLKPKAIDLGSRLILDTERCILCSRCVRFEDEVTKTKGLGIFDRGDRAIVGTYGGRKIEHDYQENLVDICPVGAFTSKPFRFRQRVWFLDSKPSICPGCSTGCNINLQANVKTMEYFRVKPRYNADVNGEWLCDRGRDMIAPLHLPSRLARPALRTGSQLEEVAWQEALGHLAERVLTTDVGECAVLVSPSYTVEELSALVDFFHHECGWIHFFSWRPGNGDGLDAFDGILRRGDLFPNTAGAELAIQSQLSTFQARHDQSSSFTSSSWALAILLAPEVSQSEIPTAQLCSNVAWTSLWTTSATIASEVVEGQVLPMKAYSEKRGTFINAAKLKQTLEDPFDSLVAGYSVVEVVAELRSRRRGKGPLVARRG